MGEIIFDDEIPFGDEIRLDAGWVDLISSERSEDFICVSRFHPCESKDFISLVNQLERSATSIGANIREAKYAHSKADFTAKLQIALKECYEAEYWLELMQKAELLPEEVVKMYLHDCGSIRRMLIASINTTKTRQ